MREWRRTGLTHTTAAILSAAMVVGLTHHIDHVLRVDHSGWPSRANVTPFTFSFVAYPILFFALLGPTRMFWWRWSGLAIGAACTLFAHTRIETPEMQYAMWANNRSLEPALWNIRNQCGVRSGGLGWTAVIVSMTLNILLVSATIGCWSMGSGRLGTSGSGLSFSAAGLSDESRSRLGW